MVVAFSLLSAKQASKVGRKVICHDVDQADIIDSLYGDSLTVTSAIKGLAATVNAELRSVLDGPFEGGKGDHLGRVSDIPSENYIQLAPSTQFNDSFTKADYQLLVAALHAGSLSVSDNISVEPDVKFVSVNYQGNLNKDHCYKISLRSTV